jgi:hypothetical protein
MTFALPGLPGQGSSATFPGLLSRRSHVRVVLGAIPPIHGLAARTGGLKGVCSLRQQTAGHASASELVRARNPHVIASQTGLEPVWSSAFAELHACLVGG